MVIIFINLYLYLYIFYLINNCILNSSWNRILGFIVNVDDVQVINGKLKDKDRNIIKERFSVSSSVFPKKLYIAYTWKSY